MLSFFSGTERDRTMYHIRVYPLQVVKLDAFVPCGEKRYGSLLGRNENARLQDGFVVQCQVAVSQRNVEMATGVVAAAQFHVRPGREQHIFAKSPAAGAAGWVRNRARPEIFPLADSSMPQPMCKIAQARGSRSSAAPIPRNSPASTPSPSMLSTRPARTVRRIGTFM